MRRASASVVASGNSMCTSRPASSAHRDLGVQPGGQAQVDQIHRGVSNDGVQVVVVATRPSRSRAQHLCGVLKKGSSGKNARLLADSPGPAPEQTVTPDRETNCGALPGGQPHAIAVVGAVVLTGLGRTVRIVPQARAYVIERLGSYSRTLDAGLNTVVPFIDRVRARIDLRELTRALDAFASGFGHHRAGEAAVPGPGAPTPEHLTAKAAAAAQSANGHTARTRGRVSKRITGGRLEGEPDRISGTPSTPAA
jgi:hypothetical protein